MPKNVLLERGLQELPATHATRPVSNATEDPMIVLDASLDGLSTKDDAGKTVREDTSRTLLQEIALNAHKTVLTALIQLIVRHALHQKNLIKTHATIHVLRELTNRVQVVLTVQAHVKNVKA